MPPPAGPIITLPYRNTENGDPDVIDQIIIKGYRCFETLDFKPNPGLNIVVGDNESGKSTLLEAIALALTGKVNGKWATEELNPFWFHRPGVLEFFKTFGGDSKVAPPELLIELYLSDQIDAFQRLRGVHNSRQVDVPGVSLRVYPSADYRAEFAEYMENDPPTVLPVEYYEVDWRDFSDDRIARRPRELATSYIDSRTIRSTSGVDYHTREMLSEHLDSRERAKISLAHRQSRQQLTDETLDPINERIRESSEDLHHNPIGLQMDLSARTSWETGIVPQVSDIPFAMSGQGQQAAIKVSLAMSRTSGASTFVLIEEPENHLSYTSLTQLIARVQNLASDEQQLFVCTHSSFVLNRLGIDRLILLHQGIAAKLSALDPGTVSYFRRLPGYDTLRLAIGSQIVLVEGPSDAIIFERAFRDESGKLPSECGVDVISMGGLTFRRALEVCDALDREAIAIQDNDGQSPEEIRAGVAGLLADGRRALFVGTPEEGRTLEPQLQAVNSEETLRSVLGLSGQTDVGGWMERNKTDCALRILDSEESVSIPSYIQEAVAFLL